MVAPVFRLPDVGEGIAEAEIVAWHIVAGDIVVEDQPLVEVMTDKVTVEITAPHAGVIALVRGDVGDLIPVGAVLIEFCEDSGSVAPIVVEAPTAPSPTSAANHHKPLASPATRLRARQLGIPLDSVQGTGSGGRVTVADLESAHSAPATQDITLGLTAAAGVGSSSGGHGECVTEERLVGLRRLTAEKMQATKRDIPHFGYVEEIDLTALLVLREQLNGKRKQGLPKLTLLPFFMRAIALLQPEFPRINAQYDGASGVLRKYAAVHVGIATQTDAGLLVPVVRHVEQLDIWQCAEALVRVTNLARTGRAAREELIGSTVTLSSLGSLGGISATPIINAPEVAILAPNKLQRRPVAIGNDIVLRNVLNLSTAFDHRVIDGHEGARFVSALREVLEQPALLFMGQV